MPLRVFNPTTPIPVPMELMMRSSAGVQRNLPLGTHLCAGEMRSNEDMQICLRRAARTACDQKYVHGSAAHHTCVQRAMAPPRPIGLLQSGSSSCDCQCPVATDPTRQLIYLLATLVLLAVVSGAVTVGVCRFRSNPA
jgi:hypothetical protein